MSYQETHKWTICLTKAERNELKKIVSSGRAPARKLLRARILLEADSAPGRPAMRDEDIVRALDCSRATIFNARKTFIKEGLEAALERKPQPARPALRRLDGEAEAHLIAIACGEPPEGRRVWTMQLLANRLVELGVVDKISDETVRRILKKTRSSHGSMSRGAFHRRPRRSSLPAWRTS